MANHKRPSATRGGRPAPDSVDTAIPDAKEALPAAEPKTIDRLNINDLKDMSIQKLTPIGKDLSVAGASGMRKQDLIFQILKAQTEQSGFIFSEGVLEVLPPHRRPRRPPRSRRPRSRRRPRHPPGPAARR